MRKIIFSLAGLLAFGSIIAQPVSDNAIIPVSVTLNSILRLNVTSGGNIEFNVNTLDQYTHGIANSTRHITTFTVASSLDFIISMHAEDGNLIGSDVASSAAPAPVVSANALPLDNVGYTLAYLGTGDPLVDYVFLPNIGEDPVPLTLASAPIVTSNSTLGAGDINKNKFSILWEMGTRQGSMNQTTLLSQNIPSDRYSTNVFLVLSPL